MMSRLVAGAAAVAAIALGLPGVAEAAAPPGLTGEQLSASLSIDSPTGTFPFQLACDGVLGTMSTSDFNFTSGIASGPYPGTFTESGSATYDGGISAPPTEVTPLQGYTAQFTINASNGDTVTGTETMTGAAQVMCSGGAGGTGVSIGPVTTTYSATITTPSGAMYTDQGTDNNVAVNQSLGMGEYWNASLNDDGFVSAALPVLPPPPPTPPTSQTPVLSNMVATVDAAGNVEVSVASTPNVINDTLYVPRYSKVAPDATPINGVAKWTVTGLSPGVHTLYAQGFTVPTGQPGPASKPVSVTFTIPSPPVSAPPTSPPPPITPPSPTPPTPPTSSPPQSPSPSPSPAPPSSPAPTPSVHRARFVAYVRANFTSKARYSQVLVLLVRKVPAGATVRVVCKGHGCPYARKSLVARRWGTINLGSGLRHRRLGVGDRITVTISAAGETRRYSYLVRARRVVRAHEVR